MKKQTLRLARMLLVTALLSPALTHAQTILINEDYDDGQVPVEWKEYNSSGKLINPDNRLAFRFEDNLDVHGVRSFEASGGKWFASFRIATESSWSNIFITFLTPDSSHVTELIIGDTNEHDALEVVTAVDGNGNRTEALSVMGSIATNTEYAIHLVLNTNTDELDITVQPEGASEHYEQTNIPFIQDADELGKLSVYVDYLWNSGSTDTRYFYMDELLLTDVDKGELALLLPEVESFYGDAESGSVPGTYPPKIYDEMGDTLTMARQIYDSAWVAQSRVDQMTANLNSTFTRFKQAIIKQELCVSVDTTRGHPLTEGFSGFNIRIADSPWNYNNPVFREGVREAQPGFLRYFSGTTGDYFDMNTGRYEPQWYEQVYSSTDNDVRNGTPGLLKWQGGKQPSRISDLSDLCGEVGAKLVVTWNGFVDGPERAANFAKFCKDNHIIVDHWQFCNEPNFYTPDRRHFFNNGEDYARKMKEIADTIRSVFPDASLALSYGWDGFGNFSTGIDRYDDWVGDYWNQVSVHSYPVHADDQTFEDAMLRVNRQVENKTDDDFFEQVEARSWNDATLLVTEYGAWNNQLKNLYGGIYVSEYVTRMSSHPQALMMGKHQIKDLVQPEKGYRDEIWSAWENETSVNTGELPNSYGRDIKTIGLWLANEALNNSSFVYNTSQTGSVSVPQMWGGEVEAVYTQAYRGMNDKDYMLVTNKSDVAHQASLEMNGSTLDADQLQLYIISSDDPQAEFVKPDTLTAQPDSLVIPPYSVMRVEWDKGRVPAPQAPRLYSIQHNDGSVKLKWWKREAADEYTVHYGNQPDNYTETFEVSGGENHQCEIGGLNAGKKYYFTVTASNAEGTSQHSNEVSTLMERPEKPVINEVHEGSRRITLHWESVPNANGYYLKYGTSPGEYTTTIDANNVSGYVIRGLSNNTKRYFTVTAYNGTGESESAAEVEATPVGERPWAPYLLHGSENSSNGYVNLSWTPSDSTHGATFMVFRSNSRQWSEYDTIARMIQDPSFSDKYPLESGRYFYRVKARNDVDISHFYSNIATVNKNNDTESIPVESIEVIGAGHQDTIDTDGTLQMFALIEPSDAVEQEVTWEVDDQSVATIDASGLLAGHSIGVATVEAYATDGSGMRGTKNIYVGFSPEDTTDGDTDTTDTGIYQQVQDYKIYPNPSAGIFNIHLSTRMHNNRYEIYNSQGSKVVSGRATKNSFRINLQGYPAGTYYIRLYKNGQIFIEQLVVQ